MTEYSLARMGDKKYTMEDVTAIVKRLTGPDGCPWDRVQTHESIRKNLIEEAYEAVDAIDRNDAHSIADELGDVLLQVLLHAAIAEKNNEFDLDTITDILSRKLISRHSHVFGTDNATTPEEVLDVWEKNKRKEKGQESFRDTLLDMPKDVPSLLRTEKLLKRAKKAGVTASPLETIDVAAIADEKEFGEVLFRLLAEGKRRGIEGELALNQANTRFTALFSEAEIRANETNQSIAAIADSTESSLIAGIPE